MAIDTRTLTKTWIQYLKNNRIAELKSDPETGKINYKRKVTSQDVADFLEKNTDFGEEAISNAIHMVLTKKATSNAPPKVQNNPTPKEPGRNLSTWHHNEITPATPKSSKRDNSNATDVGYRDVPKLREAFTDEEGYTLSEDEVELIFNMLTKSQGAPAAKSNPEPVSVDKTQNLNRLKELVRYKMSGAQRKALWRALNA